LTVESTTISAKEDNEERAIVEDVNNRTNKNKDIQITLEGQAD
jgi:hypothetical protein